MQKNELILQINEWKIRRDFYARFADSPHDFIEKWLMSQSADLKVGIQIEIFYSTLTFCRLVQKIALLHFSKSCTFFF